MNKTPINIQFQGDCEFIITKPESPTVYLTIHNNVFSNHLILNLILHSSPPCEIIYNINMNDVAYRTNPRLVFQATVEQAYDNLIDYSRIKGVS